MDYLYKLFGKSKKEKPEPKQGPHCERCGASLNTIISSMNGNSIYAGVRCTVCGKIECEVCKKTIGRLQSCSWCGEKVTGVVG